MKTDIRLRALAIAVPALILAGCSAPSASPAAETTAAAPTKATKAPAKTATAATKAASEKASGKACKSADMKTVVTAQPDEKDAVDTAMVTLTNTGKAACTLHGWVSISLVDAADEVVDVPTSRVEQPGPAITFTVQPGTSAFAGIKWVNCDKADGSCGVGNTLRYNLEASTDGPVAELEEFPAAERSGITMKTLRIGTLQPSRQGVVAW
ncbi:hypothetical protein GCM10010168_13740 [Actinoplanes ianthinogenes]|uniref:DUF4232 domain-containing protein n=1 Tax=Actinoplanes ianthinogenes TaxID=122358 RepID=A0ABM7LYY9_9ACTN|nr:DUF4232 domain-containing protein [Actinoplanes ianthinogenes]BCJ44561.1 hypothetical protein Aiant_52180 [Actinoplanes ianthinogenes]GGQ98750.1 hypothetical protein GCM10010168_13740 [Actinoplanes ianthinogenes]